MAKNEPYATGPIPPYAQKGDVQLAYIPPGPHKMLAVRNYDPMEGLPVSNQKTEDRPQGIYNPKDLRVVHDNDMKSNHRHIRKIESKDFPQGVWKDEEGQQWQKVNPPLEVFLIFCTVLLAAELLFCGVAVLVRFFISLGP